MQMIEKALGLVIIAACTATAHADLVYASSFRSITLTTSGPSTSESRSTSEIGYWEADILHTGLSVTARSDETPEAMYFRYILSFGSRFDSCNASAVMDVTFGVDKCSTVRFVTQGLSVFTPLRVTGDGLDLTLYGPAQTSAVAKLRPGVSYRFRWGPNYSGMPPIFVSTQISATVLSECDADLTGDCLVDFSDYLEFLDLFASGDAEADFNGDGVIDFADYLIFLNAYDAGCP